MPYAPSPPSATVARYQTPPRPHAQDHTLTSWRQHYGETIRLALPLAIGQICLIGIWTADILMAGWISVEALAAATQASRMYQPLYFMALGLLLAVSPLTAQAIGSKNSRRARQVLRMGMWLAVGYGVICLLVMWQGRAILIAMQQPVLLAEYAELYLRLNAIGMPSVFIYMTLRNYVTALKKPLPPVIITCLGAAVNTGLNLVVLRVWQGETALAAIGLTTSISFTLMLVALAGYMRFHHEINRTRPFARLWRFHSEVIGKLLLVGIPIGITIVSETGMFIVGGLYTGVFGTVAIAASGISTQIAAIAYMLPLSISYAAVIRVGHAAGAQHAAQVIRAAIAAIVVVVVACLLLTIFIALCRLPLIALFIDPSDPYIAEVIALALPMLLVVAAFQLSDGLQGVFTGVLRGISDTRVPAVISVVSYWGIGVAGGIVLASPLGMGPLGIWFGLAAALTIAAIIIGGRCWRVAGRISASGRIDLP